MLPSLQLIEISLVALKSGKSLKKCRVLKLSLFIRLPCGLTFFLALNFNYFWACKLDVGDGFHVCVCVCVCVCVKSFYIRHETKLDVWRRIYQLLTSRQRAYVEKL